MANFLKDPYIQEHTHPLLLRAWRGALQFNPQLEEPIKKAVMQRLLTQAYITKQPSLKKRVLLASKVENTFALADTLQARIALKAQFPSAEVRLFTICDSKFNAGEFHYNLPTGLEQEAIALLSGQQVFFEEAGFSAEVNAELKREMEVQRAKKALLAQAEQFIQMYPDSCLVQYGIPLSKELSGFEITNRGLGFTDAGIFTNPMPATSWMNHPVFALLFNKSQPTDKDLHQYKKQRVVYINTFSSYSKRFEIYLYLVALFEQESSKEIDILISYMELENFELVGSLLEKTNIGKIVLIHPEQNNRSQVLYENEIGKKTIRLLASTLSPQMLLNLLPYSGPLVGLKDTHWLGNILSLKKIPILEVTPLAKKSWNDLFALFSYLHLANWQKIAEELFDAARFGADRIANNIFNLLKHSQTTEETAELMRFIKQYSSLEVTLGRLVSRWFWLKQNKELLHMEEQCLHEYVHGGSSTKNSVEHLIQSLKS